MTSYSMEYSKTDFLELAEIKSIEHVGDIVTDKSDDDVTKYGVGLRAKVDGNSVLGYVVLDESSGDPSYSELFLYQGSVTGDSDLLFEGDTAIDIIEKLYNRQFDETPFIPRHEAEIAPSAL